MNQESLAGQCRGEGEGVIVDTVSELENLISYLRTLMEPGAGAELRALEPTYYGRTYHRRYSYEDIPLMAEDALRWSGQCKGVYATVNPITPRTRLTLTSFSPALSCQEIESDLQPAVAEDVLRRRVLLLDFDPVRAEGYKEDSSTEDEKLKAFRAADKLRSCLLRKDWPLPIFNDSGNGYHLLYRVDLPVEDGGLVQRVIQALNKEYEAPEVHIDPKVFDLPRIGRLPYTMACKGESTPERPHRMARVLDIPTQWLPVTREQLEAVASGSVVAVSGMREPGTRSSYVGRNRRILELPRLSGRDLNFALGGARRWMATRKPAISGDEGQRQTWNTLSALAFGFCLTWQQALPLIREWNARCVPPWDEEELIRRWKYLDLCKSDWKKYAGHILDNGVQARMKRQVLRLVEQDKAKFPDLTAWKAPALVPA